MTKNIISIAIAALALFGSAQTAVAVPLMELIEVEQQGALITLTDNNVLHITGGAGQILEIYNVAGVKLSSTKIDSQEKRVDLNLTKGCYIVKVGKTVRKISLK